MPGTSALPLSRSRDDKVSNTLNTIQKRWGMGAACYGAMHGLPHDMHQKIAFGRISDLKKGQV